jgi:hypothetical protein
MATSATTWFSNRAKLQIGSTDVTVLRGLEVTASFEFVELYGTDSLLRQDVAKHTAKVEVKIRGAKINPDKASTVGLMGALMKAIHPVTAPDGTIEDTNTVDTETVNIWIPGSDVPGTNLIKIQVTGVYLDTVPFIMPEGEFMIFDLTGHGTTIAVTNVAYPS